MRQSDLDVEMREAGVARQRSRVAEARRKGRESWTSYGQRLIAGAVRPVGDALRAEWDRVGSPGPMASVFEMLRGRIDPYVAAFVAVQTVLDCISQRQKASRVFISVGREIEWEIIASAWSKRHPHLLKRLYRQFWKAVPAKKLLTKPGSRKDMIEDGVSVALQDADAFRRLWVDPEALRVGHGLVELLRMHTGLVDLVTLRTSGRNTDTWVIPTAETEAYIRKCAARTELLDPIYMPMVVPPYHWTSPTDGGYRLPGTGQPLVKSDRSGVVESMTREQMPQVYAAVNHLQGVPFTVNQRVLAVYQYAWDESVPIGDMPPTADAPLPPLPPKPADGDFQSDEQKAIMREWHLVAGPIKQGNLEAKSRRILYARLKSLSERFANQRIFFPLSLDFRGRLYTQPNYLSYQGCDAARGLLRFAEGKPVSTPEARLWLKLQGANSWGVRGTMEARAAWVDQHKDLILQAAERPIETSWWRQADEPWQFLAWCCEVREIHRDREYPSSLMCWQDGTNNGLQVLSLAWRDPVGGVATNCVGSDEPRDIYKDVAEVAISRLRGETDPAKKELAAQWLQFGIDRQTTKRTVMIVPYSGTLYSSVRYIREWFLGAVSPTRPSPWPDPTRPIGYLSKVVWESIGEVVVKATQAMGWLRSVAEACLEADIDPMWVSPLGFVVAQDYPDYTACTVRTTLLRKTRMWQIRERTEKRSRRKHLDAMAPNWVHHLDVAGLMMTVLRLKGSGVDTVATVHDAIAVLAADSVTLAKDLRLAWCELFEGDPVASLRKQIEARIGKKLPPPPDYGTMAPAELLRSPYFFS
jgi:DNA-directed RNA polymerase